MEFLTVPQVAGLLQVCPSTVRNLVKFAGLPFVVMGDMRFIRSSIER